MVPFVYIPNIMSVSKKSDLGRLKPIKHILKTHQRSVLVVGPFIFFGALENVEGFDRHGIPYTFT